jgi:hypothetical protein
VLSVGNTGIEEDDDNCTVIKEMVQRESHAKEDYNNRINTEAIAGNLVGYQILKKVHGKESPDYEELNQKERDLNTLRQNLSEMNTHISSKQSS